MEIIARFVKQVIAPQIQYSLIAMDIIALNAMEIIAYSYLLLKPVLAIIALIVKDQNVSQPQTLFLFQPHVKDYYVQNVKTHIVFLTQQHQQ